MLWDGFFHGFLGDRKKHFQKAAQKTFFQTAVQQKNRFFQNRLEPNRFGTGTVLNRTVFQNRFSEPKRTEPNRGIAGIDGVRNLGMRGME